MTMDGLARGTPAFMAPELATGAATADGRADLYALGCVAYWLVTHELVFEAENPVTLLLRHVRDEPIPPSERIGERLPARFEKTILACLAKDPKDRPRTAAALDAELAAAESEIRAWTVQDAEAWWQANAAAVADRQSRRTPGASDAPSLVAPAIRMSDGS
jgi:eukaryotic-like serine/threonine-protein kinase